MNIAASYANRFAHVSSVHPPASAGRRRTYRCAAALLLLGLQTPAANAGTCQNNLPESNPDSVYLLTTVNGESTVTDKRTGLTWKQAVEASGVSWGAALAYAEASTYYGGYSDWRLPNLKELRSLVEECRVSPSINTTYFPGAPTSNFWSASPAVHFTNYAWAVSFSNGGAGSYARTLGFAVRLVRGGQ